MHLPEFFVTNAGQVGLLQVFTEYVLEATALGFLAMTIFSLGVKGSVTPEHRVSMLLSALICAVAAVSYALIHTYYHAVLEVYAETHDPTERHNLIYSAYLNIGQYRYMDWTVTTPLLLTKNTMMLRVKPSQFPRTLFCLLAADLLMG